MAQSNMSLMNSKGLIQAGSTTLKSQQEETKIRSTLEQKKSPNNSKHYVSRLSQNLLQ